MRTFPETVVMGLKSGNTSSLAAFFKVLNTTGWIRKFSYWHESRVDASIRVKSLRVRSTNLDKRVQVSHSFVIRMFELEGGEGQRVGAGFV